MLEWPINPWNVRTGRVHHRVWACKTNDLFCALWEAVETAYPARRYDRIYVVVDNYCRIPRIYPWGVRQKIHRAQAVEQWLTAHRRVELVLLPIYGPKANPSERLFGDAHDKVTRNHNRKQIWRLVKDVRHHWAENGPCRLGRIANSTPLGTIFDVLGRVIVGATSHCVTLSRHPGDGNSPP